MSYIDFESCLSLGRTRCQTQAPPSPQPGAPPEHRACPTRPPLAPQQPGSWLREILISIPALDAGSPRDCHPDRFCCRHRAREQAAGACNAPAKSWSWPNDRNKQLERPGFHSGKACVLFISPANNSQQMTPEHPIHSASICPVYAVPGELILTFS